MGTVSGYLTKSTLFVLQTGSYRGCQAGLQAMDDTSANSRMAVAGMSRYILYPGGGDNVRGNGKTNEEGSTNIELRGQSC